MADVVIIGGGNVQPIGQLTIALPDHTTGLTAAPVASTASTTGIDPLVEMQRNLIRVQAQTTAALAQPATAEVPRHPHYDLIAQLLEARKEEFGDLPTLDNLVRFLEQTWDMNEAEIKQLHDAATSLERAAREQGGEPVIAEPAAVPEPAAPDVDATTPAAPAVTDEPPAPGTHQRDKAENADIVRRVAAEVGVDPVLAVAIMLAESNGDNRVEGDAGTSFGLFQLHEGGMLTDAGLTRDEAFDPWVNARVALSALAGEIAENPDRSPGDIAAASQRPADRAGYATEVNEFMAGEARTLLGM